MLRKITRKALALATGTALLAGITAATAPASNCLLTAYSNTGWHADTSITNSGTFVHVTANVVYQGPGGLKWGSGGNVSTPQSTGLLAFTAAGGTHFFMPLNGATWGFLAASCVEGITIRYDAI